MPNDHIRYSTEHNESNMDRSDEIDQSDDHHRTRIFEAYEPGVANPLGQVYGQVNKAPVQNEHRASNINKNGNPISILKSRSNSPLNRS